MLRKLSLMCCMVVAGSAPAYAHDERMLALSLLNWLNSASDANAGAAYIYGVVDTAKARRKSARLNDVICLPANMEEAQMADIVRRFLSQNPARVKEPASAIVQEVLTAALPCNSRT